MANLTELLEKNKAKKPFKKREVRSYTFMDDLDDRPIDKPTNPGLTSTPDHVEKTNPPSLSPQIHEQSAPVHLTQPEQAQPEHAPVEQPHGEHTASEHTQIEQAPIEQARDEHTPVEHTPVEHTHGEHTHGEHTHSEMAHSELAQPEHTQPEPTHSEHTQPEHTQSEHARGEHTEPEHTHRKAPRIKLAKAGEKSEPAHAELARGEHAPMWGPDAHIQFSKENMRNVIRELTPDEFMIVTFATLMAFNRGPGHKEGEARLSHGYISRGTGIPLSTVTKVWAGLKKKGFAHCIKESYKDGNTYRIKPLIYHTHTEHAPGEHAPGEHGACSQRASQHARGEHERKNKERKNSAEPPSEGSTLWAFFSEKLKGKGITAHRTAKASTQCLEIVNQHGLEQCKRAVTRYVNDDDEYVAKAGYDLGLMVTRLQRYLDKKAKATTGAGFGSVWKDAAGGES